MRMYDIISKKRDGGALSDEEIRWFIRGYTAGEIPDYQASALLMAIFLKGMDDAETVSLTKAMADSGDSLDLTALPPTVDKHSTGGVGDKTTLIVAPLAAALGATVAKMSGRGLGHTGGTVDKLESIPGFRVELPQEAFIAQARSVGLAVVGQSGELAPADKKLYALRDVTATVDSLPLIASSIMSKKLAAGNRAIVLDVKTGSGAFMKSPEDAHALAQKMVDIGCAAGRRTAALLTDMDVPLGRNIGNALEVREAIETLQGHGPADLTEVCLELAAMMVHLCLGKPLDICREEAAAALRDGRALAKFREFVTAQGGDPRITEEPALLAPSPCVHTITAVQSGYILHMDAAAIGTSAMLLGAGRQTKEDTIDMGAGITLLKKTGDKVSAGEPLAILYTSDPARFAAAEERYLSALNFCSDTPRRSPLILGTVVRQ